MPADLPSGAGWRHLRKGRWQKALEALESQRTSSARQESMRLIGYSVALAQCGREDEALGALHLAVSADPENPAAHRERGLWFARTGDLDRSIVDLRRTVDLQADGESLRDLGGALAARGLFDEGIATLERALTHEDVPLGSVAANLAVCHRRRGDPAAAVRVLDRAVAEDGRLAGDELVTSLVRKLRLTLLQAAVEQGVVAKAINSVFDAKTEEEVANAVDAAPFLPTKECLDVMRNRARELPEFAPLIAERVDTLCRRWLIV